MTVRSSRIFRTRAQLVIALVDVLVEALTQDLQLGRAPLEFALLPLQLLPRIGTRSRAVGGFLLPFFQNLCHHWPVLLSVGRGLRLVAAITVSIGR